MAKGLRDTDGVEIPQSPGADGPNSIGNEYIRKDFQSANNLTSH